MISPSEIGEGLIENLTGSPKPLWPTATHGGGEGRLEGGEAIECGGPRTGVPTATHGIYF